MFQVALWKVYTHLLYILQEVSFQIGFLLSHDYRVIERAYQWLLSWDNTMLPCFFLLSGTGWSEEYLPLALRNLGHNWIWCNRIWIRKHQTRNSKHQSRHCSCIVSRVQRSIHCIHSSPPWLTVTLVMTLLNEKSKRPIRGNLQTRTLNLRVRFFKGFNSFFNSPCSRDYVPEAEIGRTRV